VTLSAEEIETEFHDWHVLWSDDPVHQVRGRQTLGGVALREGETWKCAMALPVGLQCGEPV
jgi:hypothetical protein